MKWISTLVFLILLTSTFAEAKSSSGSFGSGFKSTPKPSASTTKKTSTAKAAKPSTSNSTFGSFGGTKAATTTPKAQSPTLSMSRDINTTAAKANAMKTYNGRIATAAVATGAAAAVATTYYSNDDKPKDASKVKIANSSNTYNGTSNQTQAARSAYTGSNNNNYDRRANQDRAVVVQQDNSAAHAAAWFAAGQAVANSNNRARDNQAQQNRANSYQDSSVNKPFVNQSQATPLPSTPNKPVAIKNDAKSGSFFMTLLRLIFFGVIIYAIYRGVKFYLNARKVAAANSQPNYTLGS
jgi:hypothetical protein